MNPLEGAQLLADLFDAGSWERDTVQTLITHAQGKDNAKPLEWLVAQVGPRYGKEKISRNKIQNRVVRISRKEGTPCFICSCRSGLYLARNREDVAPMDEFYGTRVAKEQFNHGVLQTWAASLPTS